MSWEFLNEPFTEKLKSMELNHKNRTILQIFSRLFLAALFSVTMLTGCKVSYSFSGASISPKIKTFSIQYFQNRAPLVQPGLSQALTDALIDKCKSQTSLSYVTGVGDVSFEGEISDYNTSPLTVSANATAATNRFKITVKVKFSNSVDPDLSFEQTFSRYEDYDSSQDLSTVESDLSAKIVDMIVEDIFNQAFVNW
jgi:Lipopolysaccharide-assembly